ncbi:MAG: translation elongation factor Ts [Gemmatimonadetes bacterium]|nr:translation elongation factor Ts [Gemmatimonadota bacterium]MCH7715749.1 translation elongation factor Ts [Gemmatimonadota bacterium]
MAGTISAKDVAELRKQTGAGMMECKRALQESDGDTEKAIAVLRKTGAAKAEKRAGRSASEGVIGSYIHFNGRVGVLIELNCETDFVARTDDFQTLSKDLALHIASARPIAVSADDLPKELVAKEREFIEAQVAESGKPEAVREKMIKGKLQKFRKERALLDQPFVKDDKQTIGDLVKGVASKVGENVVVRRFVRYELGDEL